MFSVASCVLRRVRRVPVAFLCLTGFALFYHQVALKFKMAEGKKSFTPEQLRDIKQRAAEWIGRVKGHLYLYVVQIKLAGFSKS